MINTINLVELSVENSNDGWGSSRSADSAPMQTAAVQRGSSPAIGPADDRGRAIALRAALSDDIHQWATLELKIRRNCTTAVSLEIFQYWKDVYTSCRDAVTSFDKLSECDCDIGRELQKVCERFTSLRRDLGRVLSPMSEASVNPEQCSVQDSQILSSVLQREVPRAHSRPRTS